MRKIRLCPMIALTVLIIMVFTTPALRARGDQGKIETVFHASADAYVDQEDPNGSYGASEYLKVRSLESKNMRTYVFFDISMIPPGATVLRAKLFLYLSKPPISNRTYLCYHLTSAWDEGSLTWNKRPQSISTYAGSSIVTTTPGWVVWDVTDQVQKFLNGIKEYMWSNFGWEVLDSFENSLELQEALFVSRESVEQDRRPFLTIEFLPAKLNLTIDAPVVMSGEWVSVTIKRLAQDGILVIRGDRIFKQDWISLGSTTVKLSTSSGTGVFSLNPDGEPVDRVVIGNGETQVVLYYRDTTLGKHTLRASVEGYPSGYYIEGSGEVSVIMDNYPPQIANVSRSPDNPAMGDVIKVSAWVTDIGSGVKEVLLYYSTDGGVSWSKVTMSLLAGRYEAYIPGQNAFTEISYYVEASDKSGNTTKAEVVTISVGTPAWIYVAVLALIIVALTGFLYIRRRSKKK